MLSLNTNPQVVTMPLWRQMKSKRYDVDDILRHFPVLTPPVDVVGISKMMGIGVFERSDLDYDGFITSGPDHAKIVVNATHPMVRKRFTIAHELGHLMLHPTGTEFRDTAGQVFDYKEREANRFASELLMPSWLLQPLVDASNGNIPSLSRIFFVSESAMTIRIRKLYNL